MHQSLTQIGALYAPESTQFTVWAPLREKVELVAGTFDPITLEKDDRGYWRGKLQVEPGTKYLFRLDGQIRCPDPASLSQPDGVHGRSAVVDVNRFPWGDDGWTGIPLANLIFYELHVGAFSASHDFDGAAQKLDHIAELGINAIELMPLAQFPGSRNWGYDGVYPFAIQHSYGGPEGFRRLVNAAHERGIAVAVDVVYNHFGPEGNYLTQFGPYFTDNYRTPWGSAVNFDDAWSDGVRNFFLQNVRLWLEDYRVDALRLDAVHAIKEISAIPFVQQIKEVAADIERRTGRRKLVIAELDLNDPRYIHPPSRGGYGLDGQWVDEFHHALRALLTGDRSSYYEDFGEIGHLERAFRNTYVYDGVYSAYRKRTYGGHAEGCAFDQFVVFDQNHDQVGNRANGERLTEHLTLAQLKLAAAAVLLSPYVPLLFMGEEYGERNPFPFFVDFEDPALIKAVREGRATEFQGFLREGVSIPDPGSEVTFNSAVLSWNADQDLLQYYKDLIHLRKTRPALQGRARDTMIVHPSAGSVLVIERKIVSDRVFLFFNFSADTVPVNHLSSERLHPVFPSESINQDMIAPWSVLVCEIVDNASPNPE